jgi:GT2 family glycosyltransferase
LQDQVDMIIVIDNASDPWVSNVNALIYRDPQQPPNLSRLWNLGLTLAAGSAMAFRAETWDVAILNDDAEPYPGWMDKVCAPLREQGAAASCVMPVGQLLIHGPGTAPGIGTRVSGWAFALKGEQGFRFDEQFQWWCGDDDLSMWAREEGGGLAIVPGPEVPNSLANGGTTGELLAQTAIDMQRFVDKHGKRPW